MFSMMIDARREKDIKINRGIWLLQLHVAMRWLSNIAYLGGAPCML